MSGDYGIIASCKNRWHAIPFVADTRVLFSTTGTAVVPGFRVHLYGASFADHQERGDEAAWVRDTLKRNYAWSAFHLLQVQRRMAMEKQKSPAIEPSYQSSEGSLVSLV